MAKEFKTDLDYSENTIKTSGINRYMPLEYKYRVGSVTRNIDDYQRYSSVYHTKSDIAVDRLSGVPHGFARECLLDFTKDNRTNWFIERGIAISVETFADARTYQYHGHLIAHMTYEQKEEWREKQIIDKLQNSFKT
jgi:hypothetical protein